MVLLHACVRAQRMLALHLEVAHVDHSLRERSADDAEFVAAQAQALGLRIHQRKLAPPQHGNIEAWGRNERYRFFDELRRENNLAYALTAHHANDVAETLLLRLVSNKEAGEISRFDSRRRLIRPLLSVPREELQAYAECHSVRWVEDETNTDTDFLRNKVRLDLIPHLAREYDARIIETLSKRAQAIAEDTQALDAWAAAEAERLASLDLGSKDWLQALQHILKALEPAVAWRVVRELLLQELGYPLGRQHATRVIEFFLSSQEGIELPNAVQLRRAGGGIILVRN